MILYQLHAQHHLAIHYDKDKKGANKTHIPHP